MDKAPPRLAPHQLSLYNPGRLPPEQIIAAFAARRPLLARLLSDLSAETETSRPQHHLIIGQRGMGKTMLLARIAAELRTDAVLAAAFIPLAFVEEQYSVDRLSKFWLNCLDSLADAHERANAKTEAAAIDEEVARLTRAQSRQNKDDQQNAQESFRTFTKAADRTGRRPVLLVDNLQLVFERLSREEQHSLREILMSPGAPVLIGASPSPISATEDYGAAFYDQLKTHYLRPLEESEMRELLLHLADEAGRGDVRERVLKHPGRLTVLRQLTGGNPRTVLTLFFLYAEDFAPRVFGDLEGLLDRTTPLYKARFEELTDQQQIIVSAAAGHWNPITAAALAELSSLPAGTITAQLDRLEKTGTMERVPLHGTTSIGWQIAERFFNVWFLFRSASRRQRREIEFLTRFLESFYEEEDRTRLARSMMCETQMSPDRYLLSRAVASTLSKPALAEDLERHAELLALREEAEAARRRMREVLDLDALPPATLAFAELRRRLEALVPNDAGIAPSEFADRVLSSRSMFMNEERERLAARPYRLSVDEMRAVLGSIAASKNQDVSRYGRDAVSWFSARLSGGQLRSLRDAEDWNRTFVQASSRSEVQLAVESIPGDFGLHLSSTSKACIAAALQPTASATADDMHNWGYYLHVKLADYSRAEAAYREAIACESCSVETWNGLGNLLQDHLCRYEESEQAYRKAIACDPENVEPWNGLGNLLKNHLGRYEESEQAYREAIVRDSKGAIPWNGLGNLLQVHLGRYEESEQAYREAIARDPKYDFPWNGLGNLYADCLGRPQDAVDAYVKALELFPKDEAALQNLIFLERDVLGDGVSARARMEEIRALPRHYYPDTRFLHESLFAAYDLNWGLAREALGRALDLRKDGFQPNTTDDWLRATAVLIHLDFGTELLDFLDERGESARLRPWVEAIRAVLVGDERALLNVAPEVRPTAEKLFRGITLRLERLPEKTRRRTLPKDAKKSGRKARPNS